MFFPLKMGTQNIVISLNNLKLLTEPQLFKISDINTSSEVFVVAGFTQRTIILLYIKGKMQ